MLACIRLTRGFRILFLHDSLDFCQDFWQQRTLWTSGHLLLLSQDDSSIYSPSFLISFSDGLCVRIFVPGSYLPNLVLCSIALTSRGYFDRNHHCFFVG